MQKIHTILIAIVLACITFLSFLIYQTEHQKRELKEDLVELSNIKYGLFNVDEWKRILSDIITKKIEEFEIDNGNRKEMEKKVSNFLFQVIGEFENRYYADNSSSIIGFLRNGLTSFSGAFEKVKKDIPRFTTQILDFLDDPKNKEAVRGFLISKLNEYADNTFAKMDYSIHDSIIAKHKLSDKASTIALLNSKLETLKDRVNTFKIILILLAALTAAYLLVIKTLSKADFLILTGISFIFLLIGIVFPMIEIDARLAEIKISLLGEQVGFQDQILYYKSKSITEVVQLMITQGSFDLLLVGLLVFIFSVLFPFSKLVSSVCLISSPKLKSSKFIHFLVYKTGKWSMADVMVVAIFMAYIGFSGILTEQLNQIEHLGQKIEVLTTNQSSLQTGFFAFTSFVLLSLLTTSKLKSKLG